MSCNGGTLSDFVLVAEAYTRAIMLIHRISHRTVVLVLLIALGQGCDSQGRLPDGLEPIDLRKHERQVFSQFGEDGVIEKIFEIIEPTHKYAIEFGAADGVLGSNMRNLVVNHGWSSLQIEGDEAAAKSLGENYSDYPQVKTMQAWVWPGNVEILFEEAGVPKDLDFLAIDIDSNDYYVWRAIQTFRPKVVMIEINPWFPPPQRMVIEFHPMNYWDRRSDYFGASIESLFKLGKTKGYELVYHLSTGPNILFVDEKYFHRFGIEDNSPSVLFNPPKLEQYFASRGRKRGVLPVLGPKFLELEHSKIPKKFNRDR